MKVLNLLWARERQKVRQAAQRQAAICKARFFQGLAGAKEIKPVPRHASSVAACGERSASLSGLPFCSSASGSGGFF